MATDLGSETEIDPQEFQDDGKPNVRELSRAYEETVNDLGWWVDQQRENYNVRHSFWAGQSQDGRKHGTKDKPAFPWDGASDTKTMFVDQFVTADVALLCTSLKRANLVAVPVETGDMERAKVVSAFMRWLILSQMVELDAEAELLANYYLDKGIGVLGIFWDTKTVNRQRDFTIEHIQELVPELAQYISDPEYASDLTDMMQATFPELSRRKARKMVTELRNTGRTTIGIPEVEYQRPCVRAYSLDRDLFIPIGTSDIQNAPYIWKQDWYTPDQLRAKVATDGWNKEFVEHVIATQDDEGYTAYNFAGSEWDNRYGVEANQRTENIRLVCGYYKTNDEDGLPETWYTIFHPQVSDETTLDVPYAKHERLEYRPARYPFVVFSRERLSRRIMETRGYPEIAKGWQDQIKIENDTRIDRASLATNPPFLYPAGRKVDAWGPGAKIPYRRRDDYGWAEIPPFDQGSIEIEQMITNRARKYFGRANGEDDKVEAQVIQQFMTQKWLGFWSQAMRQVWSLYKQYGPDEQLFRVVGVDPTPKNMVKGDENEKFDFYVNFDVPGLDPEYNLKKLETVLGAAMKYDRAGLTDFSEAFRQYVAGVDPVLADTILMPKEEATEKQAEEAKDKIVQISSGMDVDLIPPYSTEIYNQVFQSWLTGSDTIPATDVQQRLQTDEAFRARVEKFQKQIQMQQMQEQNAQIGRTGAAPGNL